MLSSSSEAEAITEGYEARKYQCYAVRRARPCCERGIIQMMKASQWTDPELQTGLGPCTLVLPLLMMHSSVTNDISAGVVDFGVSLTSRDYTHSYSPQDTRKMLSFLRASHPPRTNNASKDLTVYEKGTSSVQYHSKGSEYIMTHTIPPTDPKEGPSIIQPPFHYHIYQAEVGLIAP